MNRMMLIGSAILCALDAHALIVGISDNCTDKVRTEPFLYAKAFQRAGHACVLIVQETDTNALRRIGPEMRTRDCKGGRNE